MGLTGISHADPQANSLLTKDIALGWDLLQRKQKRLTHARLRLPGFWSSKSVLVQISCHHHGSLDHRITGPFIEMPEERLTPITMTWYLRHRRFGARPEPCVSVQEMAGRDHGTESGEAEEDKAEDIVDEAEEGRADAVGHEANDDDQRGRKAI